MTEVGRPGATIAAPRARWRGERPVMTDIGDTQFHKGQPIWVISPDGGQREATYVGEGETSAWFGGPPTVIVVYPDQGVGEAVEVDRVIARNE